MRVDKDLLTKSIKKDQRSQNLLYKYCYEQHIRTCYRYASSKQEAISLFNEGFVKIIMSLKKYDYKKPFEAWSHRVIQNAIIDNYIKNKRHYETTVYKEHFDESEKLSSENTGEEKLCEEDILNLIQTLPATTRQVFNLYVMDGYIHKEISELLAISIDASKWHLSSARKKLRILISKELYVKY